MSSKILVVFSKVLAAAAIIIIVGCSGISPGAVSSGVFAPVSLVQANGMYRGLHDLYVADYGFGSVKLLTNKGYKPDGEITYGMNGPYDVTLDKTGNLYVANRIGDNISEYAPGATQPMFVYNAGMRGPLTLSVDHAGNLYEIDQPLSGGSVVNEYLQQSNVVLHSCSISDGLLWGVAVDSKGDVFVDYDRPQKGGFFAEYTGGLAGCSATQLGAHVFAAGGMILDRHNNIVATDFNGAAVYVFAPPYSKVTRKFSQRLTQPYHISINRANTKLFVTDFYNNKVFVIDYVSGKTIRQLSSGHGLGVPFGAVDGPNNVL